MRSSVFYLIGFLSIIQGLHFSNIPEIGAHIDPCVAKILSCDWHRQSFSLYKENDIGMFKTIEDLEKACKDQAPYIKCMGRAEKFCKKVTLLPMAEEMIRDRRFSADVCRPVSPWQQLYLVEASCLNAYARRDYMYCTEKFIGIDNLTPENTLERGCKYERAIIDCSATRLQEKCGYYAGIILKKILKFHNLSDYKCKGINVEYLKEDSSTSDYDMTEEVFYISEDADLGNERILEKNIIKNIDYGETKLDNTQIFSDSSLSKVSVSIIHFDDESLTEKEDFLSDSLNSDAKLKDITLESNKPEFLALPNYHYVHKNRTIFALYEELETGYSKYIGCGEADVFWVILSPLRNNYCSLTDFKSKYSEVIFKCTVHIDSVCSSELGDEDVNENAEVFHNRYVASVLTPPKNQGLSEIMAIMNVNYFKMYPSHSMHIPEKNVNLWTAEVNKATVTKAEFVGKKGSLKYEDNHNDILYQHGNGSGQKMDTVMRNNPYYSDDEYYEYNDLDYHPLEDEDFYFPELQRNDIIYIEDDKGELISLHDPRSPIYSNSLYQPHSLFRPRIGTMPAYCSVKEPCLANSDKLKFGIKEGMYIKADSIKIHDPFKGQNLQHEILSPSTLNEDKRVYIVKPSSKIELLKSTHSSHLEERQKDQFATDHPSYLTTEEIYDDMDIKNYPTDYTSTVTSIPYSKDSQKDSMEISSEYYNYKFTQSPYIYFHKSTDTEIPPIISQKFITEGIISPKFITDELSENESSRERYLMKIFGKVFKILLKKVEKSFERK